MGLSFKDQIPVLGLVSELSEGWGQAAAEGADFNGVAG